MHNVRCQVLLVLLLLLGSSRLQAADWFQTVLAKAEAESQRTGKPIFLDAFTTWCAPCLRMDAEVFSQAKVRDLLLRDFVPLRLDMEQADGLRLRDRFGIGVYPTLLVFDAKGEIHRSTGFMNVKELTAFAKTCTTEADTYRTWRKRYDDGARDTLLLGRLAAYAKTAALADGATYIYAYLQALDDWDSEQASLLMLEGATDLSTPLYDSLVARQAQVAGVYGAPVVDERIARLLDEHLFGSLPAKPRAARRAIARTYPNAVDSTFLRYRMRRAREAGKAKRFGRNAIRLQRKFPLQNADELAELIYVFDERLPDWKTKEVSTWKADEARLREE